MRTTLIFLALLLAGCRSHPLAPAAAAEPAGAPQMLPRIESGHTRPVELKNLKVRLVESRWRVMVFDAEGRGTVIWKSGPAIEFNAGFDLHGWTLGQFVGARHGGGPSWYLNVSIDSDGPGLYDGYWDYDAGHTGSGPNLGVVISIHDRKDEEFLHDIVHGADITMWASDRDSLSGAGGVRWSIPLEDVGLTRGPVRYKLYAPDDSYIEWDQYIGIVGDGVDAAPIVQWGKPDEVRSLQRHQR